MEGGGVADQETAKTLLTAARNHINAGQAKSAITILEAGIKDYPADQTLRATYAEALMHDAKGMPRATQAQIDDADARLRESLTAYQEALQQGVDNPEFRDVAATIAMELGDYQTAELYWGRAMTLDPSNPKYPFNRAMALRKQGKQQEAKKYLLAAANLDPTMHQAWGSLAGIALDERRLTIADQHIRKARDLAPNDQLYLVTDAKIQRGLGRYERAATLLLSISERNRLANDEILRDLSYCYALLDEPERAVEMYQKASQQRPNDAGLHFELAQWAQRVGDLELALAASEKAVRLGEERAIAIVEDVRAELGV